MNIDFDKIVSSIVSEGGSIEEAAKQFSAALNKAAKAAAEKKKVSPRDATIAKFEDTFDEHVKAERLDLSDAAALVWLAVVKDTDDGKKITSTDDLYDLYDFICNDLEGTYEKWQIHKAIKPFLEGHKCECRNKREDTRGGPDRKIRTDEESIKEFLRGILP